ncbi:MAG: hypothetical protein M1596_03465 [Firmicutes bacterium]|jgi:hypothetical protein|nr:hypothetical protein [Bacillota bacterium]
MGLYEVTWRGIMGKNSEAVQGSRHHETNNLDGILGYSIYGVGDEGRANKGGNRPMTSDVQPVSRRNGGQ